jgi:hypothetical protein
LEGWIWRKEEVGRRRMEHGRSVPEEQERREKNAWGMDYQIKHGTNISTHFLIMEGETVKLRLVKSGFAGAEALAQCVKALRAVHE